MAPIALVLALFMQAQPAAADASAPASDAPAAAEAQPADRYLPGTPHDDYQFVAWCYGSLRGYMDLHDQVMPEVTRIEKTFRPPDRKLSDDLKVYDDMQKEGRIELKIFRDALTAAEKASLKPINVVGAQAVSKGHDMWTAGPDVTPARLAQAWMSWALPARCETIAKELQSNATLLGASLKVNDEPDATPPADPSPQAPASIDALLRPADRPAPADASQPEPASPDPAVTPEATPPKPNPNRS